MAMAGLYRRILPSPPAIDFASLKGKKLFIEAIQNGTMEGFYKLISYFQTQSEPAYCGLASLSMVLNSLAIDPGKKWKGPWRWFDESMLDCCEPLEKVKAEGISFGKLVCLAHCAGAKVEAFHTSQSTVEEFRKHVLTCSTSDDCHVISSYHRENFKQTGDGHFSPIGGYHAGADMALILDVARFKYPPHWVPLKLLWEAMDNVAGTGTTKERRGFMLISRPHREPGLLYTLSCKHESWVITAKFLMDEVPLLLKSDNVTDIEEVLSVIFKSLPSNFNEFIKWVAEVRRQEDGGECLSQEEKRRLSLKEEVLNQVKDTLLFKHVRNFMSLSPICCKKTHTLCHEKRLPDIAKTVCCQGAEYLSGESHSLNGYCCLETCVKCVEARGEKPITVVTGTVVSGKSEQGVDMLVPFSQENSNGCGSGSGDCPGMHPASNDVLTALLLALPRETWAGIKDDKLFHQINCLVSTDNLPQLLQEEVKHLRRQLLVLRRCQGDKVDNNVLISSL